MEAGVEAFFICLLNPSASSQTGKHWVPCAGCFGKLGCLQILLLNMGDVLLMFH